MVNGRAMFSSRFSSPSPCPPIYYLQTCDRADQRFTLFSSFQIYPNGYATVIMSLDPPRPSLRQPRLCRQADLACGVRAHGQVSGRTLWSASGPIWSHLHHVANRPVGIDEATVVATDDMHLVVATYLCFLPCLMRATYLCFLQSLRKDQRDHTTKMYLQFSH